MATIPREKLSKFFRLFAPEYVLGTTYTISLAFFESVVFPCLSRNKLRKCLLLCDRLGFQRATSEAVALRSATREYMVATVPTESRFHPKVWVLVGEQRLALLVGSGNLTQSGFIDNIELFEAVELEAGDAGAELCEGLTGFLREVRGLWKLSGKRSLLAVDALEEIEEAVAAFADELEPGGPDAPRFLSSFDGPFPESLREVIGERSRAYVAAPYFGGSTAGLQLLQASMTPSETAVFPAVHSDGKLDVDADEVSQLDATSLHLSKLAANKSRFAHLKLYGFVQPEGTRWLFTGSVNCTAAALSGVNVEAGILRQVPRELFDEYFAISGQRKLPADQRDDGHEAKSNWFTFWATDLGDRIELVAESGATLLPLQDVQIELTSGGTKVARTRDSLFDSGDHCRLAWSDFRDAQRSSHAARVLEIRGTDADGESVHGTAFVDDLAALTSEPTHRGAWRAALTLLSAEALPEYSDIAALFQLVEDVVATEEDAEPEGEPGEGGRKAAPAGSTREILRDKAAVWPPQPIEADVSVLHKGHGSGDLYWFNRILASLIQRPASTEDQSDSSRTSEDLTDENDEQEAPSPRVVSVCERMWSRAYDGLCDLENRLCDLGPTAHNARRIWGPSTFIFLSTLGIKNAVQRTTLDDVETPSSTSLARDFVAMLLGERDQGEDFAPLPSSRYGHEVFPSLAKDLADAFGVHPHFEVCGIVATVFAHLHAAQPKSEQHSFPLLSWLIFRDVAGDNREESVRDVAHLEHVWQRYLNDGRDGLVWEDVRASLAAIGELSWQDHPGLQSLLAQQKLLQADRYVTVDDYDGACMNDRCRALGRIDPQLARELRQMSPATCKVCGFLLVPEQLWQAYEGVRDGKAT